MIMFYGFFPVFAEELNALGQILEAIDHVPRFYLVPFGFLVSPCE